MAAAFATSVSATILPSGRPDRVIDYSLFVNDVPGRKYDLRHPFAVRGAIYATDSRILVRHPGELTGISTALIPDVEKLWWREFDRSGWKRLGSPRYAHGKDNYEDNCPVCRGYGIVGERTRCLNCDGDEYWWDRDFIKSCGKCVDGWTGKRCEAGCQNGSINYVENLAGFTFGADYMNRLRTLGELDYRIINVESGIEPHGGHVLLVRGVEGIRGMLCGIA